MKILGIGVDIIKNKRIENLINNKTFIKRTFGKKELKYSKKTSNKTNYFAKRFAAKEAFAKSIGTGFRNTHLRAIAPTVSNSKLAGNVSPGIEPWAANVFTEQSAKGTFIRKNKELKKVLRKVGIDTKETWDKILEDGGSVQGIKQLDGWYYDHGGRLNQEEGELVKNVFKTFKEINQLELIRQAGIRQDYIDQSVSLNLAFPSEASPRWLNQVHIEAWKRGVKTLYYTRTESVLRGDIAAAAMDPDCLSCDG